MKIYSKPYLNTYVRNACDNASPYGSAKMVAGLTVLAPLSMGDTVRTGGHEWHLTIAQYDFDGRALWTTVGTASASDSPLAIKHPDMFYTKCVFVCTGNQSFEQITVRRSR